MKLLRMKKDPAYELPLRDQIAYKSADGRYHVIVSTVADREDHRIRLISISFNKIERPEEAFKGPSTEVCSEILMELGYNIDDIHQVDMGEQANLKFVAIERLTI